MGALARVPNSAVGRWAIGDDEREGGQPRECGRLGNYGVVLSCTRGAPMAMRASLDFSYPTSLSGCLVAATDDFGSLAVPSGRVYGGRREGLGTRVSRPLVSRDESPAGRASSLGKRRAAFSV